MSDWSDFCEGDSGVPLTNSPPINYKIPISPAVAEWNRIEADMKKQSATKERPIVRLGLNEFTGDVYAIATNRNNSAEARVAALALVWDITKFRVESGDPDMVDTSNE